jgi:hypothetical protein
MQPAKFSKRVIEVSEAFHRLWPVILAAGCSSSRITCTLFTITRFLALLRRLHIHPVCTPTEASWLNAIEAHFGVTKRATLTGSDDPEHLTHRRRIYRYLRYRNRRVGQAAHRLTRIRSIRPIK